MMRSTCRRCHGKGFANRHPCKECGGGGQTKQRHKVRVPVPAGIEDGQTVRMTVGKGRINKRLGRKGVFLVPTPNILGDPPKTERRKGGI